MANTDKEQKLKVFISYSRRDASEFGDELVGGLELAGFLPYLDRHDIAAGEDWEARLGRLIQEADTVMFVVSPEAVKSERCAWEVDRAHTLSKRLLPVSYKPVDEVEIPERLRRLQFVRFDLDRGVTRPLGQLAEALATISNGFANTHGSESLRHGGTPAPGHTRCCCAGMTLMSQRHGPPGRAGRTHAAITDLQHAFLRESKQAETADLAKSKAERRHWSWVRVLVGVLTLASSQAWSRGWNMMNSGRGGAGSRRRARSSGRKSYPMY